MNSYENPTLSEACDLYAEIDRLQALNAELVAALRELLDVYLNDQGYLPEVEQKARAALAKSKDSQS